MYKPTWFTLDEIFPPEFLAWCRAKGYNPWMFMDERVLITADEIRHRYGATWVNNWNAPNPGTIQYAGFRPLDCLVGGKYSTHKFGRALDLHFTKVSAEEVRNDIHNKPSLFPLITRIEKDVSWFHFDVANVDRIIWF